MPEKPASIDVIAELRQALKIEIEAIEELLPRMDASVEKAVALLFNCKGKVVVTGMGKSGHIALKIASTLSSTGTAAIFLHPAEAIHGDLGMVSSLDVVWAISNSGTTAEVLRLLGPLRRIGSTLIAMTGNPESELAQRAEAHLNVAVTREACPLNLAPTASTTAALAMGDAIAVCLLSMKGFRAEDYAVFHPGGDLGKKLLTTAGDLMESGALLPVVADTTPVAEAVNEIQAKRYGVTGVVDQAGVLRGAFSLGDLMRLHIKDRSLAFMDRPVGEFMTPAPHAITPDVLAARALNTMETRNIRALFITDSEQKPVGILGIYEVLKAIDY